MCSLLLATLLGPALFFLATAEDCSQVNRFLLQYANTQCGAAILGIMPPPMPDTGNTGGNSGSGNTGSDVGPGNNNNSGNSNGSDNIVTGSSDAVVGSYYPNWFVYRKHYMGLEKFGVSGVSVSADSASADYVVFPRTVSHLMPKLTHLYYAFLNVDSSCWVTDADPDASWYGASSNNEPTWIQVPSGACKGSMNDMMSLKDQFPHLKLLISLGGWTFSENFSACVASSDGPAKIYDSFSFYLNNADPNWGKSNGVMSGVDFDWEHPGAPGDHENFDAANDWANYAKLVQYFRNRANSEGRTQAVFTSAIGLGDTLDLFVSQTAAAKSFCGALDFVNMMTYDLHGKWDPTTGHNAQFCQIDNTANAMPAPKPLPWAVKDRIEAAAAVCGAGKLTLGIPNYTPAWTKIPSANNGLYQTATDPNNFVLWSTFSDSDSSLDPQGIIHWWDLKKALASDSSFQVYSKNCPSASGVVVPVKWVYSSSRQAFACYEDPETVQQKTKWARAIGMKGFFFWDVTQDKDGDLLDAARSGWGGLPSRSASGSPKCRNDGRPDFSKNPDGSKSPYEGCTITSRSVSLGSGEGCAILGGKAAAACGKPAFATGATRAGESTCVKVCNPNWGNGDVTGWVGDTIYYVCEGEEVVSSGGGSGGGSSSTPCTTSCSACKPTSSGAQQGLTDAACTQQCAVQGLTWWPCGTSPLLCGCA